MLVKPMRAGVHTTVLMDCCHSGTVLDLPYKLGATDRAMTREPGFDMDIVTVAERPKPVTPDDVQAARERQRQRRREKDKEAQKRAERQAAKGMAPVDEVPVGPKLAPNGAPVLPTRRAPSVPPAGEDEATSDTKTKKRSKNKPRVEGAPPTPGKAWQFWKK